MSHEVFEIIRNMDLSDIEVQMALQCAPFISGLKVSNLFIVHDEHLDYLIPLLNEMNITWKILSWQSGRLRVWPESYYLQFVSIIKIPNMCKTLMNGQNRKISNRQILEVNSRKYSRLVQ